ncbi:MAG: type IV pilus twitching motility protein PilT [Actinobacteria bacterium]|nr:type IV pilus twitching motility protein PilT [Actinomycetota bacterium]
MNVMDLLVRSHEADASDVIIKVGAPPLFKVHGDLSPVGEGKLSPQDTVELIRQITGDEMFARFERDLELDLAYELKGLCRFRVNVFRQRGSNGMVLRRIPAVVPTCDELSLPELCKSFAMRPRGLVLVTGPTGCGKTTTLAALIRHRNENEECHVVTIEDPVEYVHHDKLALINQRQVGPDTVSFARALKSVLRQDPDVILVGEMRDLETISLTITAAETGHLALATLHTSSAIQTVDRIIDVFPPHQQEQIRMQLSVNLIGVVSQVLLKRIDGKGRIGAFEIMVATPAVRNLIREGKTFQLGQLLQTGSSHGMITMNKSLANLVNNRRVTLDEALSKSPDSNELKQMVGNAPTGYNILEHVKARPDIDDDVELKG